MVHNQASEDRRRPAPIVISTAATAGRRADAVRNHARVLEAARRVVDRCGAGSLTMDAVAAEAGVGKGTVFRHFEDRAGLLHALLEEDERAFQEALLSGPPPLGPGAPAGERLRAFGPGLLEYRRTNLSLLVESDRGRPLRHPVYGAWHTHVRMLVAAAAPHADADTAAHMLLATLNPILLMHLTSVRDDAFESLADTWARLVDGLCDQA